MDFVSIGALVLKFLRLRTGAIFMFLLADH